MGLTLSIDPAGTELVLHDPANGWRLTEFDAPGPDLDSQWASSADTEGERRAGWRHTNRTITAKVKITKSSDALLEAAENLLGQAIGRLQRDGGELELGYPSGETITFDVLEANFRRVYTPSHLVARIAEYELSFVCLPLGEGAEQTFTGHSETTLPCLTFDETIPGDVAALGKLEVGADAATTQQAFLWGMWSRYASSASTAPLFIQAEALSLLGLTTRSAGPAGASGSGSNVMRNTQLGTSWTDIINMKPTATGLPFTHLCTLRVIARVWVPATNTGTVSVRLRWGRIVLATDNDPVTIDPSYEGSWRLVDLGQVQLPKLPLPAVGVDGNTWVGNMQAQSTVANDDIDVDCFFFVPVSDASGEAEDVTSGFSGNQYLRYDGMLNADGGRPERYEGDYLRIPPGLARFIVKFSRAPFGTGADSAIDDHTATLTVIPRYLNVPAA